MQIERFIVTSHMDELPLSVLRVRPDNQCKAIVQILHGMCEHKERYLPFMEYLAEQGFASIIHDHRGHGESVFSNDDLGYMYQYGAKALVEDTNQINRLARKSFPNIPCFLFGHSMGSLIARDYIKRNDRVIDGLIVCGSPSNNEFSGLGIVVSKIGGKIFGERTRANRIMNIMFRHYNDHIKKPKSKNTWICCNEQVVEEYDRDSLCGFPFTFNGTENLCKLIKSVYSKDNWHMNHKDLPIWFISGTKDPCMISERKFKEAIDHLKDLGYNNVTYKMYKGMRHEILNEVEHQKVFNDIVTQLEVWMDRSKR